MFYTDQPIRGGIPAFRALDASRPARFAVIRRGCSGRIGRSSTP